MEIFKKTGTEIGKKAAERSGGLFSADDWQCSRYIPTYVNRFPVVIE